MREFLQHSLLKAIKIKIIPCKSEGLQGFFRLFLKILNLYSKLIKIFLPLFSLNNFVETVESSICILLQVHI